MSDTTELTYKLSDSNDFYLIGTNETTGPNAISHDYQGKLVIPNKYLKLPIKEIGQFAFYSCKWITEVEINADIIIFHKFAFDRCSSLQRINIPSSTEYLGLYAITFTTETLGQMSGSAEIIFEPHSKRIVAETFVKKQIINIYLCDIINPDICEYNWHTYSTVNVYSPYEDLSFCDLKTKKGIHTECLNLYQLLKIPSCNCKPIQIHLPLNSLIFVLITFS